MTTTLRIVLVIEFSQTTPSSLPCDEAEPQMDNHSKHQYAQK